MTAGGLINKNLIGVDGPGPVGAQESMRNIGVHWVRTDVNFGASIGGTPAYDCNTGSWNPTDLDQRISAIRAEGGVPLTIIDYSPQCLSDNPLSSNFGNASPDVGSSQPKWSALVEQMALHEIKNQGVRYFEVWNEPDWIFFTGGLQQYLTLYKDTSLALERAATQLGIKISVGGPALADVLDTQNQSWLQPFLEFVNVNKLPLDFISWHSYANDPFAGPAGPGGSPLCLGRPTGPGTNPCYYNPNLDEQTIANEVVQTRNDLSPFPNLHPLLIVDEWNLDGEGDPRQQQSFDAAYAAAVLQSAQDVGLNGSCWFFVANSSTNPDANWGLLSKTLVPEPAYETFLFWHDLAKERVEAEVMARAGNSKKDNTEIANSDANGRVGAVASKSTNGVVTVLLYNFKPYDVSGNYGSTDPTPYDRQLHFEISGLNASSYHMERTLVDGNGNKSLSEIVRAGTASIGSNRSGSLSFNLDLPGESVELVTFKAS